tara:strand:+ start:2263 stop:2562 length:300 start_codon:yes stop_codon:yes gene_type:complete
MTKIKHAIRLIYKNSLIDYEVELPFRLTKGDFFEFEILAVIGFLPDAYDVEFDENIMMTAYGDYVDEVTIRISDEGEIVIILEFNLDDLVSKRTRKTNN